MWNLTWPDLWAKSRVSGKLALDQGFLDPHQVPAPVTDVEPAPAGFVPRTRSRRGPRAARRAFKREPRPCARERQPRLNRRTVASTRGPARRYYTP
jgi:hypothetical protein